MFKRKSKEERIQDLMKKLNIKLDEIEAYEVIIKSKGKDIFIRRPKIMVTNVMGRNVYQVTGEVSELPAIKEEDVKMVMKETGKKRSEVLKKLEELNNDLAKAIIELKKKK